VSSKPVPPYRLIVTPELHGERLDRVLPTLDFISSRSRGADLIERGLVCLNGKALRASYRVQTGNQIEITLPPPAPTSLLPLDAPLDILFEDQDLIVINKPSGLVVHPAAGHAQDTLVNMLLHHSTSFANPMAMGFDENRPGIVHRLDRDTSGVLVVAKNDHAHHALAEQFRKKTVHRIYWAVTWGVPKFQKHTVRSHLARHPQDRKRFASSTNQTGKLAITHLEVKQSTRQNFTWMQCRLETGRTHQIRVHLSEM